MDVIELWPPVHVAPAQWPIFLRLLGLYLGILVAWGLLAWWHAHHRRVR